jgi:hypothetical protein
MLANRWLRPFARFFGDPNIWHFNRRCVARGAAVGMFFGLSIPFAQAPAAALLSVPLRANVPVAALVTFISNPFTTPFIYLGAYELGSWMLQLDDGITRLAELTADSLVERLTELVTNAPLPIALGLLVIASIGAAVGYFGIDFGWRLWVARRAEARRARRLAA